MIKLKHKTDPIVALTDLKEAQIQEIKEKNPLVYSKFLNVQDSNFYSARADPVEFLLKKYRKNKISILLKDVNKTLENAKYERYENTDYFLIPNVAWSTLFFKRFNTYVSRKKRGKECEKIIDSYYNGIEITEKRERETKTELVSKEWIYPYEAPGDFLYDTKYCALAKVLEELYVERVLSPLNMEIKRMEFGSLIPKKDYLMYDYFEPHMHLLFCCNKPKDELVDLRIKSYLEKDITGYEKRLKEVNYFHNYNSCSGLWPGIKNKNFSNAIGFFDSRVKSYRNEQGKVSSLERLEPFNRFELTYICKPEVQKTIHAEIYQNLCDYLKTLEISYKSIKSGAWFDESLDLDTCFSIDFESPLSKRTLEVCNLSINHDHYTSCYGVKIDGKLAVNGCSGMGIQRLVYLFLLNHTVDLEKWPTLIKKRYTELLDRKAF